MNREDAYKKLLAEFHCAGDDIPAALAHTVTRAQKRAARNRWLQKYLAVPAASVAVFMIAFITMVNVSATFAIACGRVPLLRSLAAAVTFSPSLSAAVDNAFVQPIELEQEVNGITMRVEYVIVDQKQLNIFYTLDSDQYFSMSASPSILNLDGTALESYGLSSGSPVSKNGELRHIVADFISTDVPDGLLFRCRVHDNGGDGSGFKEERAPMESTADMLFQPAESLEPDYIATFDFALSFDPTYTQQGETIALDQSFLLDGQSITITTVEIFPTHMRINLDEDADNTAWLTAISFYMENEKGQRFEPIGNGISATGSESSRSMVSHRLESVFFYKSQQLTLHITGVTWLDKEWERIRVDLPHMQAAFLPEGVVFEKAQRKKNGWELTFSAVERAENHSYQLFGSDYYDEDGNAYWYTSWSSGMTGYYDEAAEVYVETPGVFRVQFPLVDYTDEVVYLSPAFTRQVMLQEAVVLSVK